MPERNENGVKLLYEYYNQLIWLEKRMFTNQKFSAIQFTWFDSLTAHQTANESIAYEKASILFNIGVLWTQIAAAKVRVILSFLSTICRSISSSCLKAIKIEEC